MIECEIIMEKKRKPLKAFFHLTLHEEIRTNQQNNVPLDRLSAAEVASKAYLITNTHQ